MSDKVTQVLGDNLTIATVEQLFSDLELLGENPSDVVLDGHSVERVDTAALQTILAFKTNLEQMQLHMEWEDPSETLVKAAKLLGVAVALGLDNNQLH